jgi:hypothetical protein
VVLGVEEVVREGWGSGGRDLRMRLYNSEDGDIDHPFLLNRLLRSMGTAGK